MRRTVAFKRSLRAAAAAGLVVGLAGGAAAHACTSCYGEASGPMIDGARMGVFLLLGVVLAVEGGIVAFFVTIARRARRLRRQDAALDAEWAEVQRSAREDAGGSAR